MVVKAKARPRLEMNQLEMVVVAATMEKQGRAIPSPIPKRR
jgi:hypothetical protein